MMNLKLFSFSNPTGKFKNLMRVQSVEGIILAESIPVRSLNKFTLLPFAFLTVGVQCLKEKKKDWKKEGERGRDGG